MFVKFKINNKEAYALNHHLCHVSSSYYSSPFDEATIITQDGGGDSENFSVGLAKGNKILNFETKLVTNIAGWWSSITLNNYRMKRIHRWDPGSGAGKIMALAAYGKPDDNIEQLLEDTMKLGPNKKYTDKYSAAFNHNEDLSDDTSQRSKDVAASLQSKTEKELKKIYDAIFESYPNKNLCLAGGIALNCVANTRVKSNFENLHVPPFPNDTGLAVGMALYHWHHILDKKKETKFFSPYLGPVYTKNENLNAIKKHNSLIRRFLKFEKKIFYEDSTIEKISDYIAQRKSDLYV